MTIDRSVLMCHAPIVIPEIGRDEAIRCAATTRAMQEAATFLIANNPDVLVLISPHAPRDATRWGLVQEERLTGDFRRFGARDICVLARGAPGPAEMVAAMAEVHGLATSALSGCDLDHGTMVPLLFVVRAGWSGPTLVLSLPYPGSHAESIMGEAIAAAAKERKERWVLLASGDMSHRLKPGAPSGYDPHGADFDAAFVEHVREGHLREACGLDDDLRDLAAEDVVDSVAVAAGATGWACTGHRVLSYEAPFGVGYLEAVLHDAYAAETVEPVSEAPVGADLLRDDLVTVARDAIERAVRRDPARTYTLPRPTFPAWGVFVTLRDQDDQLRGCMGHIDASEIDLGHEVAECARLAALRDPRFPPLTPEEIATTSIEVSVLEPPEPVANMSELDPKSYGVVVRSGKRRGLLLPDIEGVDTPEEQVTIAMRKGDIRPEDRWTVERFRVRKAGSEAAGS